MKFISNPNAKSLAEVLRNLTDQNFTQTYHPFIPWPLLLCLSHAKTDKDLKKLASAAEQGDLGDFNDWKLTEKEWQKNGVTLEKIAAASHLSFPIFPKMAKKGIPPLHSWAFHRRPGHENIINVLVGLFYNLGKNYIRNDILRLIEFLYTSDLIHVDLSDRNNFDDKIFRIFASEKEFEFRFLEIPVALAHNESYLNENLELIDSIGHFNLKNARLHHFFSYNQKVYEGAQKNICKTFIKNPSLKGLLIISRNLAVLGFQPDIPPELLMREFFDDPDAKSAALIVWIAQGKWGVGEVDGLTKETIDLQDEVPGIVHRILDTIENYEMNEDAVEALGASLLKHLSFEQIETRSAVFAMLRRISGRRSSNLQDKAEWDMQNFPPTLWEALYGK